MKSSCLNVFQRNNYVVIKINEGHDFETIEREIERKVTQLKKLYKLLYPLLHLPFLVQYILIVFEFLLQIHRY